VISPTSDFQHGLSRNGYVPTVYERTNSRGVPWFGLITAFVIGCVCFLPFPSAEPCPHQDDW
jgi:amino acid permease